MAMTATTTPPSIALMAVKDSTSGLYYITLGNIHIWFGSGTPTHSALAIGDLAVDEASGKWYRATDTSGSWTAM